MKDLNENSVILRGQYGAKHFNHDIEAFGENTHIKLALLIGFLCVHAISPISIINKKYFKFIIFNKIEVSDADVGLLDMNELNIVNKIKNNVNWSTDDQVIQFLSD